MTEGVIKFKILWAKAPPLVNTEALRRARQELFQQGLIGAGADGIGFGNISQRLTPGFVITGSGTGGLAKLGPEHLALVRSYEIEKNSLTCVGPIQASSESMSHAALYECSPEIKAVAHVHNKGLWLSAMNQLPTTGEAVPYGTPEMANEIIRLYRESDLPEKKVLVMGGHTDGIIAFGQSLDECLTVLLETCDRYKA